MLTWVRGSREVAKMRTAREAARRAIWSVLGLIGMVLVLAVFAAPSKAVDVYYCKAYVVGYNACPYVLVSSQFNDNHAYVPGAHFGGVCEKVTLTNGLVGSRRCSNTGYIGSDATGCPGDLGGWYYKGYTMVAYAGNNQDLGQTIVGHALIVVCA